MNEYLQKRKVVSFDKLSDHQEGLETAPEPFQTIAFCTVAQISRAASVCVPFEGFSEGF